MSHRNDAFASIQEKLSLKKIPPAAIAAIGVVLALVFAAVVLFAMKGAHGTSFVLEKSSTASSSIASSESDDAPSLQAAAKTISVHVAGSVSNPGMYSLPENSRVNDAIELAGGFAEGADTDCINLARVLTDGEQVVVPEKNSGSAAAAGAESPSANAATTGASASGAAAKVNVNTATDVELDAIPGVGPSLAKKIVSDRNANGPFKTIDDLTRVSGIGDKKLESMREYVTVG